MTGLPKGQISVNQRGTSGYPPAALADPRSWSG